MLRRRHPDRLLRCPLPCGGWAEPLDGIPSALTTRTGVPSSIHSDSDTISIRSSRKIPTPEGRRSVAATPSTPRRSVLFSDGLVSDGPIGPRAEEDTRLKQPAALRKMPQKRPSRDQQEQQGRAQHPARPAEGPVRGGKTAEKTHVDPTGDAGDAQHAENRRNRGSEALRQLTNKTPAPKSRRSSQPASPRIKWEPKNSDSESTPASPASPKVGVLTSMMSPKNPSVSRKGDTTGCEKNRTNRSAQFTPRSVTSSASDAELLQ